METGIPAELQEKLKIIQRETDFFSQTPRKPNSYAIVVYCVFVIALTAFIFTLRNRDYFTALFFVMLLASQVSSYFYERKLFKMYSGACEIINYYKKKENQKAEPTL